MLKKVRTEGCVSIIMNTHRTSPQSQGDVIQLKNLVKKAEERLFLDYDKNFAAGIMYRLNEFVSEINHLYNQDSLGVFVNNDIAVLHRMTIPVKDRVEIGDTFSIRDLIHAENESAGFYVLVLSRRNARLLEAYNNQVVKEEFDGFPIVNETLIETDTHKLTMANGQDNLIEEFFNQIDIKVQDVINHKRLPLVVATEERNFHHYMTVTNDKKNVIAHLNRNRDDEPSNHIVAGSWELVHDKIQAANAERLSDLKRAVSAGKFVSDVNDISRAINEGRGKTLFVRTDYYQPGVVVENRIEFLDTSLTEVRGVMEDVLEKLVAGSIDHGGDVVFLDGDELDSFEGLALLTRY